MRKGGGEFETTERNRQRDRSGEERRNRMERENCKTIKWEERLIRVNEMRPSYRKKKTKKRWQQQ